MTKLNIEHIDLLLQGNAHLFWYLFCWKRISQCSLETGLGDLDLLGEIVGGGGYDDLLPHTIELQVFGHSIRCLDLEKLIHVKRAAGRPKDLEAVAELEAIREERDRG